MTSSKQIAISPTIFLVDSDHQTQRAIQVLVDSMGYRFRPFATATAFLDTNDRSDLGCVLTETAHSDMDAMEMLESLRRDRNMLPVIILSNQLSIPDAVLFMKAGASDILEKPLRRRELRQVIRDAVHEHHRTLEINKQHESILRRFEQLTPLERQVLALVAEGMPNRKISETLAISERSASTRRSRIQRKLAVKSNAELMMLVVQEIEAKKSIGLDET